MRFPLAIPGARYTAHCRTQTHTKDPVNSFQRVSRSWRQIKVITRLQEKKRLSKPVYLRLNWHTNEIPYFDRLPTRLLHTMRIHCLKDGQVIRVIILWKHIYRFMICIVWVLPGVFPLFLVSCVVQWRFCKIVIIDLTMTSQKFKGEAARKWKKPTRVR